MDNPENLEILKILVQTDAVRFGVPFCICLLFSYHAPFLPHTVCMCHCCTCAAMAHLNMPALRYNESCQKRLTTTFSKQPVFTYFPVSKNASLCIPDSKYPIITHLRSTHSDFFHLLHPFAPKTVSCIVKGIVLESISSILNI